MATTCNTPFAKWQRAHPKMRSTAIVAHILGVSRQRTQHWLDGRSEPRLDVLTKLCALTGLDPHDFIVPTERKAQRRSSEEATV